MAQFYLECQNFWDIHRWMLDEKYFIVKAKELNIDATTIEEQATLKDIQFERKFEAPTQYFLPIPIDDINKNPTQLITLAIRETIETKPINQKTL